MEGDAKRNARSDALEGAKDAAGAVGKTAVAAALAGAVVTGAAAVTPDQIQLPDPTPIVQTIDQPQDLPDSSVDDQAEKKELAAKRILKLLKYAVLALFFAAAFIFGVLQGCASCAGQVAGPMLEQGQSSSEEATSAATSAASATSAHAAASSQAA